MSWPAGSDNVAVSSYEVSSNGGTSYSDVGNVLTHTFTGLTSSTSYSLRVRAKDAAGNVSTALSATQSTNSSDVTNPTLSGSISVSSLTVNSYTLSWSAGSDNVAVTGYEYSLNGGTSYTNVGNALTVSVVGRTPGATDQVRVRAYDAAGNRSNAIAASVTLSSGAVTTPPLENTDGTLHLNATVHWSWYPGGRIGSFGSITPQEGTGTTNLVDGTLTLSTLTAGTGVLMTCVRSTGPNTDSVHYHFVTA
jgi:chitodextrinase